MSTSLATPQRFGSGLAFALFSALCFGLSGVLASGLISNGWSPAAVVTVRVVVAALALAVPTMLALRGRWYLVKRNVALIVAYGVIAVAGVQFAYFSAIAHMDVAVALLIEYTAPVAVVGWIWLRYGHRPNGWVGLGALIAAVGLALVLQVGTRAEISGVGLVWALIAMVGVAGYFILSAQEGNGLPPIALAGCGLAVAAVFLTAACLVGLIDWQRGEAEGIYRGHEVAAWLPLLTLGVVSGALAYASGIAAGRRLGARMASFVALSEVLAAVIASWLVLGQVPGTGQFLGGFAILAGVVVVKLGEPTPSAKVDQEQV
ncbi:EamA family transporter [Nocardioides sp. Bht2]|uniref:EamA family transporter n=1 Tax=Nocardioides sp. Bht2 TaxID=3392297 RepID=UPI0039B611FF